MRARGASSRSPRGEELGLGSLSSLEARELLASLPCVRPLAPRDAEVLVRFAEGMPGRIARLAHAMGGRQRVLFPPLCEPGAPDWDVPRPALSA